MAICSIEGKDVYFKTFKSYLEFLGWVLNGDAPENGKWGVENSNMQNTTFDMSGSKEKIASKSRNVGKNQAVSQLTVDLLKVKFGAKNVFSISPKQKGRKLGEREFKAVSGITIGTSQDERDAWLIAEFVRTDKMRFYK